MPRPSDTSPDIWDLQVKAIRSLSSSRRVQMAIEMSETARKISDAGAARRREHRGRAG